MDFNDSFIQELNEIGSKLEGGYTNEQSYYLKLIAYELHQLNDTLEGIRLNTIKSPW